MTTTAGWLLCAWCYAIGAVVYSLAGWVPVTILVAICLGGAVFFWVLDADDLSNMP